METVASSLAVLNREFGRQLPALTDLTALQAQTHALLADLPDAGRAASDGRLDAWARDCALAFDQLQTLTWLCAEMLEWHGRFVVRDCDRLPTATPAQACAELQRWPRKTEHGDE